MAIFDAGSPRAPFRGLLVVGFLGLGLILLLGLTRPGPVRAAGQCDLVVGTAALSRAGVPENAIDVAAGSTAIRVQASSSQPGRTTVDIGFGPFTRRVFDEPLTPVGGNSWSWVGTVDVTQLSTYGVGLYQIKATAGGCELNGWARLTGKAPYATPVGWGSIIAILVGLLLAVQAFVAVPRGGGGLGRALLGGAVTGAGLLVFAQQAGLTAARADLVVVWIAVPAVASGAIHSAITLATRAGALSLPPAGPPTTAAPPAGPPTTAAPPTATAAPPPATATAPPAGATEAGLPGAHGTAPAVGGVVGGAAAVLRKPRKNPDPPRVSFARVDCPEAVVAQQEFELTVGLAAEADPLVVAEPLRRPDSSVGPYTVTIQIIADGFTLRTGESWRVDLPVTAAKPYPAAALHLVAGADDQTIRPASIRAMFSVDGHPIGLAVRPLAVVANADLLKAAPKAPPAPAVDMSIPSGQAPPDLTVRIERSDSQASGRLLLQLLAADPSVEVPTAPMTIDIGGDPAQDLRRIINEMNAVEGKPTQFVSLRGIGLAISEQLPNAFWDVLRQVAARLKGRPPMILFLSAEPYVPWELAVVDPPLDPSAPPFLSAQANVGRWVLGQRRPKLPPPTVVQVETVAVVSGVYDMPGWERLVEAEGEAADLVKGQNATPVTANVQDVLDLLRGKPSADLIHFAVHGNYDGEGTLDGLICVDGNALDPLAVRGTPISGTPFIFLNACQVGRGNALLGDYSGMAEAFLYAGASGVIAPLWSIDDRLARQIAIRFYDRALAGDAAADILRSERAAFKDSPETMSSTYVAYQYFGHPALRLERVGASASPEPTAPGSGATPGSTRG